MFLAVLLTADLGWWFAARRPSVIDRPFQRATGGIGLSSTVSVAWSFFAFDPRTEPFCENELWPIPGLTCPNPHHGATVVDLPPLCRPLH